MATTAFRTFSAGSSLLVLNTLSGILTSLSPAPCQIVNQVLLTETEVYLLEALFEVYPSHATYAALLSALTDEPLEEAQARVNEALNTHTLNMFTRSLRQVLFRLRGKLQMFGLDIRSLQGLGYQLLVDEKRGGDNDA
jgi:hypothetical protein